MASLNVRNRFLIPPKIQGLDDIFSCGIFSLTIMDCSYSEVMYPLRVSVSMPWMSRFASSIWSRWRLSSQLRIQLSTLLEGIHSSSPRSGVSSSWSLGRILSSKISCKDSISVVLQIVTSKYCTSFSLRRQSLLSWAILPSQNLSRSSKGYEQFLCRCCFRVLVILSLKDCCFQKQASSHRSLTISTNSISTLLSSASAKYSTASRKIVSDSSANSRTPNLFRKQVLRQASRLTRLPFTPSCFCFVSMMSQTVSSTCLADRDLLGPWLISARILTMDWLVARMCFLGEGERARLLRFLARSIVCWYILMFSASTYSSRALISAMQSLRQMSSSLSLLITLSLSPSVSSVLMRRSACSTLSKSSIFCWQFFMTPSTMFPRSSDSLLSSSPSFCRQNKSRVALQLMMEACAMQDALTDSLEYI